MWMQMCWGALGTTPVREQGKQIWAAKMLSRNMVARTASDDLTGSVKV